MIANDPKAMSVKSATLINVPRALSHVRLPQKNPNSTDTSQYSPDYLGIMGHYAMSFKLCQRWQEIRLPICIERNTATNIVKITFTRSPNPKLWLKVSRFRIATARPWARVDRFRRAVVKSPALQVPFIKNSIRL
jgi:hypothetical protein